ncbi:MAG: biopolymer transport protein ExbD [Saprospiraceae bacterium]|jgi:biopolymer transport protein ExbD
MSKFKKNGKRSTPGISTASLPDIVFILLFFFMVVTVSKEEDLIVDITMPNAAQCTRLEDKSLEVYINVGAPVKELQGQYGAEPRIQLNDAIKDISHLAQYVEEKRQSIKQQAPNSELGNKLVKKMVVSLKVDQETKLGTLDDIKQELRKLNALKVNYVVNDAGGE